MTQVQAYASRIETAFAPLAEQFQQLWINLSLGGNLQERLRLLVSSPRHDCGCTSLAAAMAVGLARHHGAPTLLVESNLSAPSLDSTLGLSKHPGLYEVLAGQASLEQSIFKSEIPNLSILSAGNPLGDAAASLGGTPRVFEELGRHFECLVVDAGPILDRPENVLIAQSLDKCVLVARAQKTSRDDIEKAAEILRASGLQIVGSVLNFYKKEAPDWILPD